MTFLKSFRLGVFAGALALLIAVPCAAFAYTSPGKPTGYVNDFAAMLAAPEKTSLETKLAAFEKKTGDEIAVVTVPTIGDDYIENYAVKLFEEWGIGKKGKDNGVLVLIARDDHEIRIEVGYGLEPELTDIEAGHLIDNVLTPAFRQGNFYAGIDAAADQIILKLQGENPEGFAEPVTPASADDIKSSLVLGFIGLVFVTRIFAASKSWWLGGVLGAGAGLIVTVMYGFFSAGLLSLLTFIPLGLFLDFVFSKIGPGGGRGGFGGGMGGFGGGFGSGGGSSFGGFGGGSSGGGGASGK